MIGQKLGQYEIIELLGQGGMATVYKAHQESIGRFVAIKVLPPHAALDEQFVERFQLEAKTIGSLQHPHILSLYDYGQQDDILYLVMAYVDGGSLEDLIQAGVPLPQKRTEKILREIASALDFAHRRGVIHRDIKPANILLDSEGNALLADFGIVKMMGNETNLTGTGVVGTPAYIAPEQGSGETDIDGRADLYSLACVMYQLLSGYQPYTGDTMMKVVLQHIADPVPSLRAVAPDLPEAIDHVIARAMSKSPDDRYENSVEFAEAVAHALHNSEESLAAIRSELPLDKPSEVETMPAINKPTGANEPNPTIVVQQSTNTYVFLGMFGLIALVIVVVAIVLIGQQNRGATVADVTDATEVADNTADQQNAEDIVGTQVQVAQEETFGEMRYNSTNQLGDTINLQVSEFVQPSNGNRYVAWMKNTATGDVMNIGEIVLDATGRGILIYTDEEERMLSSIYNSIAITEELTPDGEIPEGEVVYGGQVPVELSDALHQIFISSPDGFDGGGLLAGAQTEAGTAQTHSENMVKARTTGSMKSHSEHVINIIRGTKEDHDGNESPQNPGREVGVFFFIDKINQLLVDVVEHEETSIYLQRNAEFIFVCTDNVSNWSNEIVELAFEAIAGESKEAVVEQADEAADKAKRLTDGVDDNGNGQIEAFEGECGMNQIPAFGIQVANIDIVDLQS